jgi:hypothetical protein
MTNEEAIQLLTAVTEGLNTTWQSHIRLKEALQTLTKACNELAASKMTGKLKDMPKETPDP